MTSYLAIFFAGFLSVFALGFQSRNVNTGKRKAAMLTSMLIALSQGTLIVQLAQASDWTSRFIYAVSGACGIWCAMEAHDRLYPERKST